MRSLIRVLGGLLAIALVLAAVELVHPRGILGLVAEFGGKKPAAAPVAQGTAAAPAVAPPVVRPPVETWGPGAAKELSWADRDLDRGDFDGAVANYTSARVLAANVDERTRATQGLEKALLGWALTRGAVKVSGKPADLEAEYQRRLAPTERLGDEKAWVDLVRWTAGAGLRDRLPYVCGQALDSARPGGYVQSQCEAALDVAGSRRELLAAAIVSRGLASGAALASLPTSPMTPSGIKGTSETSGIGGVNERGVPFGRFTATTRDRLREAIVWERQGAAAYEGAGPDNPRRAENRHAAIDLLRKARDVYLAAQEEDGDSRDLDDRLKRVMMMLAQLKKDEGIGR